MKRLPPPGQIASTQVVFHLPGSSRRCGTTMCQRGPADRPLRFAVGDWVTFFCIFAALLARPAWAVAQSPDALTKVAAGTLVDTEEVALWTHRILVARPRVAVGDVDDISETVKKHAELLSFVLVARVEQSAGRDAPTAVLKDVGVGLATEIDGRLRVVSGAAAANGPASAGHTDLGFIANQVLRNAQRSLDEMRVLVRRTTLVIYDSPAVIKLNGGNQICVVRSMIWVEPQTGKLHHAIWSLQRGQRQHWVPALEHGVYLPVPFEEDRILHVDSRRFSFGIPAATAFGLASLPPGYPFSLAGRLGELACQETYNEAELRELAVGLIAELRREASP